MVDVQNDFADPGGALYVTGGERVIPAINGHVGAAVAAGATVVYTQDWHPPATPHFAKDGGTWPVHCVGGTPGAGFHPALELVYGADFLRKGVGGEDGYSAFTLKDPSTGAESGTGLVERLREAGIETVVVVGLALDYCVKATALDAVRAGFDVALPVDATLPVNLAVGDGARSLVELVGAGVAIV